MMVRKVWSLCNLGPLMSDHYSNDSLSQLQNKIIFSVLQVTAAVNLVRERMCKLIIFY